MRKINGISIYPDLSIHKGASHFGLGIICTAETYVRIKRKGKWYLIYCKEVLVDPSDESKCIQRLLHTVYGVIMFYKITNKKNFLDMPFEIIDESQYSEEDRLVKHIEFNNQQ